MLCQSIEPYICGHSCTDHSAEIHTQRTPGEVEISSGHFILRLTQIRKYFRKTKKILFSGDMPVFLWDSQ